VRTRTSTEQRSRRESLLVLSDVHLGSDLNEQAQTTGFGRRSKRVDRDLAMLLRHYRGTPPQGERWRLVIAGDFVDFIGITLRPDRSELSTEPSEEELEHGLGNAEDHARIKMRRVGERHAEVFRELALFVADGNALTVVHGNHDVEFHWDVVKKEFRDILITAAKTANVDLDEASFGSRIEFNPWFFYVADVAYIEHGHMYDPFCATDHVMAPLSPLDPRRIARGFCDVLIRFVVRPTRGLKESGHEHLGIADYVRFGVGLGVRGMASLGVRFFNAVVEMFRLRRGHFTEAARALRAEHERRMMLLGEATKIGIDRLKALVELQVPPVTRSIGGIMASVLLDRLALGLLAIASLAVVGVLGARSGHSIYAAACIVVAWALTHRHLTHRRRIDPAEDLMARAGKLARLFPAAFVVMGHTHIPVKVPVEGGHATYINLGSWAEEEEEDTATDEKHAYHAARTHLVIHPQDSGPQAEFLKWDSDQGPRKFG
jgi:UDP-2,3-diacylglucosamine pyrophosphatase LpxH